MHCPYYKLTRTLIYLYDNIFLIFNQYLHYNIQHQEGWFFLKKKNNVCEFLAIKLINTKKKKKILATTPNSSGKNTKIVKLDIVIWVRNRPFIYMSFQRLL